MKNIGIYLFLGIFAVSGIFCGILFFATFLHEWHIRRYGIKTEGTVVALNHSYHKRRELSSPVVNFVNKKGRTKQYTSNYSTNINEFKLGEKVTLWYDPAQEDATVLEKNGWAMSGIMLLLFLTHGGAGIGGIVWMERKRRLKNWLDENGYEIEAKLAGIKTHSTTQATRLRYVWTDPTTQMKHEFLSKWLNSSKLPKDPPESLQVRIDPYNPKRYYVDSYLMNG